MSWNPINIDLIKEPLNWLMVGFVFVLMCVVTDALIRRQQNQGAS